MSFESDINKIVKKTSGKLDTVVRKTAADMFSSVIEMTPRDKGVASGNWNTSIGKPDTSVSDSKTSKSAAKSEVVSVTSKAQAGDVIYLSNGLPYIRALEYGHSKTQAPRGMVRITVARFQETLNAAIRAAQ